MWLCFRGYYYEMMSHFDSPQCLKKKEFEKNSLNLLDRIDLDCGEILKNDEKATSFYKNWIYDHQYHERQLYEADDKCSALHSRFHFGVTPLSKEEADFPLAYGFVVYKNPVQILFSLSSFYQPQNLYCFAVDGHSSKEFKKLFNELGKCLPNVHVFEVSPVSWGTFSIVNAVWSCLRWTTNSNHTWKYYQYLSGVDIPLKTNWEMVQILKALNGTINMELSTFQPRRLTAEKKASDSPIPLYKSSLSALVPREAARIFVNDEKANKTVEFLRNSRIPDEGLWATLAGNPSVLKVPGGLPANEFLKVKEAMRTKKTQERKRNSSRTDAFQARFDTPTRYYFSRYQIWGRNGCYGKLSASSCIFGVKDLPNLLNRPELVAHKLYIDYQPAAFFCILKENQRRTLKRELFNAINYTKIPQVEYERGVSINELTHPEFIN
ncbi:unnamed protein product, partial [Mesorhabditis belari]|uniref:Uncharacterized protein n=1 Tax=Mesorhabditis belari TaxID=2138241 RepID=A0AAF3EKI4_9BILA